MRIMAVSDIHGSVSSTRKILDTFYKTKSDTLLILGDILYHGPRNGLADYYDPKEVSRLLNEISSNIVAVRGNCDSEVDQMMLDFSIMSESMIIDSNGLVIFASHGHRYDPFNPPPIIKEGNVLLSGHTHETVDTIVNGIRYVNPGSLSFPKGGVPSYAIIDNGKIELFPFD